MKNFKRFILCICLCLFSITGIVNFDINMTAFAQNYNYNNLQNLIKYNIQHFVGSGEENSLKNNRIAGGDGEKAAAEYLKTAMEYLGLEAINDTSTVDGFQLFDVNIDGVLCNSQNVRFVKKSGINNNKKVIISTHYDNEYYYDANNYEKILYSEGVFSSGASVGLVLAIAEEVSKISLDFDVEIVFFGSHYQKMAGSAYYTSMISRDMASDILLAINYDNVVSDGDIYLYNGEFENKTDSYIENVFSQNVEAKSTKDYSFVSNTDKLSVTGLPYTHVALESDSAHFLRVGTKVLNILAVDNENIDALNIINYTRPTSIKEDTYSNLENLYSDKMIQNLANMFIGTFDLICDAGFVETMSVSHNYDLYKIFSNEKMAVFITAVLFVIICFVLYLVYLKLKKSADEAKKRVNFDAVMAEVTSMSYDSIEQLVSNLANKLEETEKKNSENKKDEKDSTQTSKKNKEDGESEKKDS